MQPIMPERPSVEPTERSIPDVMMTIVIPMASKAVEETWLTTFMILKGVKK